MYKVINNYSGVYYPGFLTIELNTEKPLLRFLQDDSEGVFFHEYVHYIQDFLTTYGISNCSNLLKEISSLYTYYKQNDIIEIPFRMLSRNVQEINKRLFRIYLGYLEYQNDSCEISNITESYNRDIPNYPIMQYQATLKSGKKITLGTHCVLEAMAQLLQEMHHSSTRTIKMIPYDLVTAVVAYYLPGIQISSKRLVSLCEISLLYYNSMELYIRFLHEIKKEPSILSMTDEEFYNHFYTLFNVVGEDGRKRMLVDEYNRRVDELIEEIENVFRSELYVDLREWFLMIINRARALRNSKKSVFSSLYPNETWKDYYKSLITSFGFPPVTNQEGEVYLHMKYPVSASHLFLAVKSVFDVLHDNAHECILKDYCIAGDKWEVTEECYQRPWSKKLESGELCPFCAVWKTFGLEGKMVVYNYKNF